MNCVLDASCLINLISGERICAVLGLAAYSFLIGPIVRSECIEYRDKIDTLLQSGSLTEFKDEAISGSLFLELMNKYNLGDGETECLAYCINSGALMACDDKRARNVAEQELGPDYVTGTLTLLNHCVSDGILTSEEAYEGYEMMRRRGAFLPRIGQDFFEA